MALTRKVSESENSAKWGSVWQSASKTLVVATDFSVAAEHARDQALHWLLPGLQRVVLLHVLPERNRYSSTLVRVEDILKDLADQRLLKQRQAICQSWDIPFPVECISREGPIHAVLQEVCSRYLAPIVVMGNVGVHSEQSGDTGSARKELLAQFNTFPLLSFSRYKSTSVPKNILYASDVFEMESLEALKPLVGMAIPHQATIHIAHIGERNIVQSSHTEGPDRDLVPRYLELFPEVAFTYKNLNGNEPIFAQLRSMVSTHNIDLVFVVMQQHGFYHNFLQTAAAEDGFFQAMPVLTVRI